MPHKLSSRFFSKIEKIPFHSCWEWTGSTINSGYGVFYTNWNKNSPMTLAHRVSYIIHKGKIPNGMQIMHSCDNKKCVNPDHLSIGTCQQNADDRVSKKRQLYGGKNPMSKLTESQAKQILEMSKIMPYKSIHATGLFPVTAENIRRVCRGDRWGHLKSPRRNK